MAGSRAKHLYPDGRLTGKLALSELCELILKRSINKSSRAAMWDQLLTEDLIKYASLDAWASVCLYSALRKLSSLSYRFPARRQDPRVPKATPVDLMLLGGDEHVATGLVVDVLIGGHPHAKVAEDKKSVCIQSPLHKGPIIVDLTTNELTVVVLTNVREPGPAVSDKQFGLSGDNAKKQAGFGRRWEGHLLVWRTGRLRPAHRSAPDGEEWDAPSDEEDDHSEESTGPDDQECLGDLAYVDAELQAHAIQPPDVSAQLGQADAIDGDENDSGAEPEATDARVKGDAFHYMHRLKLPRNHGARVLFCEALRDAMLPMDPAALKAVDDHVRQKFGYDEAQMKRFRRANFGYYKRRVPRYTPRPDVMYRRVKFVFERLGGLLDAATKAPLLNEAAWKIARGVLKDIEKGFATDPVGLQLYFEDGKDKDGLTLYRCARGTNSTENVHVHIMTAFGATATGATLADCLMADFRHGHNIRAAVRNRVGVKDHGHYDLWLIEDIQRLTEDLYGHPDNSDYCPVDQFCPTGEQFGICPMVGYDKYLPEIGQISANALESMRGDVKYVAQRQGLLVPFIGLCTDDEFKLFRNHVQRFTASSGDLDAEAMALWWGKQVDAVNIWPKLPTVLRAHHKRYLKGGNRINTEAGRCARAAPVRVFQR